MSFFTAPRRWRRFTTLLQSSVDKDFDCRLKRALEKYKWQQNLTAARSLSTLTHGLAPLSITLRCFVEPSTLGVEKLLWFYFASRTSNAGHRTEMPELHLCVFCRPPTRSATRCIAGQVNASEAPRQRPQRRKHVAGGVASPIIPFL